MINIQTCKTDPMQKKKGRIVRVGDSYIRLDGDEGRGHVRGNSTCCCCCKSRKRSRKSELRRLLWSEKCVSLRLTSLMMTVLMLGGALYLDCIITATPNILMDDPNSPDTEVLLVGVEELSIRYKGLELKVPVSTTVSAKGYLQKKVNYDICDDYDDVCKMLRHDGQIWFYTCIIGIALTLPPLLLNSRCKWKSSLQCLSFLPALVICFVLGIWWLNDWLTLSHMKTASYPFHSTYANETTLIEMTFEDKGMLPGYSLCLVSLAGLALCLNFGLIMCA